MCWIFRQLELRLFAPTSKKAADAGLTRAVKCDGNGKDSLRAWCVDRLAWMGMQELSHRVRIRWNPRMRTTAGRAWWPDRVIELNPKLNELPPQELWRTLTHELAHLVAYEREGRRRIEPHGREWRAACAELGIPDEKPFHTLPLKGRRMKRNYSYTCPSCLSSFQRVRRIRRAVACYDCCRKFTGGSFDKRFRLSEQKL